MLYNGQKRVKTWPSPTAIRVRHFLEATQQGGAIFNQIRTWWRFVTPPWPSLVLLLPLLTAILSWRVPAALAVQTAPSLETDGGSNVLINEIMAANVSTLVDPDFRAFGDWIEIYNPGEEAVALDGYTLTDDSRNPVKWSIPPGTVVPGRGYGLFWADGGDSGRHTNFGLNRDGEEAALYDADGLLVDQVSFGAQVEDVSFGRTADGASEWAYFQQPTPGRKNEGESVTGTEQAAAPTFTPSGGRYQSPVALAISSPSAAAEIHYTLDGSRPTADSARYQEPIELTETVSVRARVFTDGLLPSPIRTQTYLIGEPTGLPIVSLVTDPAYLWDPEIGIYVDEDIEVRKEWERPATIALYEPDGSSGFQVEASIRLFGRSAIHLPQKSLAVFITDAGSGQEHLFYPLFPDRDLNEYASFLLRSGSDDWAGAMLRDGFAQDALVDQIDLGTQAFRPALLFVNGRYFGIHNMREKQNEAYLVTHYGVDLDDLDLLFVGHNHGDGSVDLDILHGDADGYEQLATFAACSDLTTPENYAVMQTRLDTDHFIDYIIVESYVGNTSWHRNRKAWRAHSPPDPWDFLVYDLDRGFGRRNINTLQDITNLDPLFKALLTNEAFKNEFIQRFAHHLNGTFAPERLVPLLDSRQAAIAPEIERHRARWQVAEWWAENYEREAQITGRSEKPELPPWEDEIAHIRQFVRDRPDILRQHIVEAFALSGTQFLTLDVKRAEGGHILVEGLPLAERPFTGVYFRDVPLRLTAVAEPGYRFVTWQGPTSSRETTLSLLLSDNETVTAVFEPIEPSNPWIDPRQPRGRVAGLGLFLALVVLLRFVQLRHH